MTSSSRSHRHLHVAARGGIALVLVALGLVPLTGPAIAASCNGASHDSELSAGKATPGSGLLGTVFRYSVRYADTAGCPASSVVLVIPGVGSSPMVAGGGQPVTGVTYRASRQLPIGVWGYRFEATSGEGQGQRTIALLEVSPTSVTVVAPTPAPTSPPTPDPTPAPTPHPTPTPVPDPTSPPSAGGGGDTPSSPTPAPGSIAGLPPRPGNQPEPGRGAGSGDPSGRSPVPATTPGAGTLSTRPTSGQGGGLGREEGTASEALARSDQGGLRAGGSTGVPIPILAWLLTTGIGVCLYAVMLRRSAGEESSPLAAALSMAALARANRLTGPGAALTAASGPTAGSVDHATVQPGQSRFADSATASRSSGWRFRPPLRFETGPPSGIERRQITYRLVRLSDEPDDLRSREIMRLDRGDEIEILGSAERFLEVRTPSGEVGWIPRTAVIG